MKYFTILGTLANGNSTSPKNPVQIRWVICMLTVTLSALPRIPMRVCQRRIFIFDAPSSLSISKAHAQLPPASKRAVAKAKGSSIAVLPCQCAG